MELKPSFLVSLYHSRYWAFLKLLGQPPNSPLMMHSPVRKWSIAYITTLYPARLKTFEPIIYSLHEKMERVRIAQKELKGNMSKERITLKILKFAKLFVHVL